MVEHRRSVVDDHARRRTVIERVGGKQETKLQFDFLAFLRVELESMPRASKGRDPNLTTFSVVGFLNPKNVTAEFVKQPDQSWWNRRPTEENHDAEMEQKRRKLMGTEEELQAAESSTGGPANLNVLQSAPPGALTPTASAKPLVGSYRPIIHVLS